jgi:hypothetical protein
VSGAAHSQGIRAQRLALWPERVLSAQPVEDVPR